MDALGALDALDALEQQEQQKKTKNNPRLSKDLAARNAQKNAGSKQPQPQTRRISTSSTKSNKAPPPPIIPDPKLLAPYSPASDRAGRNESVSGASNRSPSANPDSRRISFAEPSRPPESKLWIPTVSDSLASGFAYDQRLHKYNVSEEEWTHFTGEVIEAAAVPGPSWLWSFRKKDVIKNVTRDLQYEGPIRKVLKKWNRIVFKKQRFQASLELPGVKEDTTQDIYYNEREVKARTKKFRIVISQEGGRAPSVYSRSSSLTRSVTGEGKTAVDAHQLATNLMKEQERVAAEEKEGADGDT